MRLRVLGLGALIVTGSAGVIAAQHGQRAHATQTHEARPHEAKAHQTPHDMCGSHEAPGAGHHAAMAADLGLTAEQTSTIERLSIEACALMAKYHEQIQAVLTPEQRAKMQEHHGAANHGGSTRAATRKHGGK